MLSRSHIIFCFVRVSYLTEFMMGKNKCLKNEKCVLYLNLSDRTDKAREKVLTTRFSLNYGLLDFRYSRHTFNSVGVNLIANHLNVIDHKNII